MLNEIPALRRGAAALLAAGLSALALGACGGSGAAESASATDNERETARLKLEQCLRENGVELPARPGAGGGAVRVDRAKVEKAIEGPCKNEQQAAVGTISEKDRQEFEDAVAKFSQCMRDNGVDVPDVVMGGPGPSTTRSRVDRDDPKVRAAQEKCQSKLPRGGPGGGGLRFAGPPR